MKQKVKIGENPMMFKKILAKNIVSFYHGKKKAKEAEESFIKTFQKGEIPEEMTEVKAKVGEKLLDLLVREKIISSKSDFRRLVEEKAVTNLDTEEKLEDVNILATSGMRFRIGKKRFVKII